MSQTFANVSRRAIDSWCTRYVALSRDIAASPVLRSNDKIVFTVLAGYLFKTDNAKGIFPSIDRLATDCGLSVAIVGKSLHRLRYGRSDIGRRSPRNGWKPLVTWEEIGGRRYYRIRKPTSATLDQLGR